MQERLPRPARAVDDDIRALNVLRVGCKRVLEVLPRAVPGQVVHHHLRAACGCNGAKPPAPLAPKPSTW